ncbi:Hypothetical predicted protein [Olea europaea subsp. europaea]|uniref:Senescence-associated protein n=1 Tax=Olea europaea subsp. europaea TaxID=158383 RepID=A0A8S0R138_OLEEU|nr:Hypothetical predicted protein [Olea europaea subsp. europaea]
MSDSLHRERVGAEASRGRTLSATIKATVFRGHVDCSGFGRRLDLCWSTPRVDWRTVCHPSTSNRDASSTPIHFLPDNFKHSLTLFSKFFSSLPRQGRCLIFRHFWAWCAGHVRDASRPRQGHSLIFRQFLAVSRHGVQAIFGMRPRHGRDTASFSGISGHRVISRHGVQAMSGTRPGHSRDVASFSSISGHDVQAMSGGVLATAISGTGCGYMKAAPSVVHVKDAGTCRQHVVYLNANGRHTRYAKGHLMHPNSASQLMDIACPIREQLRSSVKDSTHRLMAIVLQGGQRSTSAARVWQTTCAPRGCKTHTTGRQVDGGKSRHRRIKKQRRYERLAATSHYRCSNFSDTSSFKFRRSKGSLGHDFTVHIRTGNQNQMSFYLSIPHEISVLVELILGHLRYLLTNVLAQSNSTPDNVFHLDRPAKRALGPKRGTVPRLRFTK